MSRRDRSKPAGDSTLALEFVVIGAEHPATAIVRELLRGHPQLWLPEAEELPVFAHTSIYERGLEHALRSQGTPVGASRLRGSVIPSYMRGWHDTTTATVAARIARALPDVKLIALLSDPIERARSEHRMAWARGRETRRFDEAARRLISADGLSEGRFLPDHTNAYLTQGEYGRILGEYLRYFPRTSLHIELTTELNRDPLAMMDRILRFLGVSTCDPDDPFELRTVRQGAPEPTNGEIRAALAAHYEADAELLRAITGVAVPWLAPPPQPPRRPVAVFTAIAGGRDTLEDPEMVSASCDYVCFTDNPYVRSAVWQVRPLEIVEHNPAIRSHRPKLLAERYLPEYEARLWVDANLTLRGDPALLVRGRRSLTVDGSHARAGGPVIRSRPHADDQRAAVIRREMEEAETVMLSFPKAGRSWVCYFLARYVAELTGVPLDLNLLGASHALPPVAISHEHIDVFGDAPAPVRLLHTESADAAPDRRTRARSARLAGLLLAPATGPRAPPGPCRPGAVRRLPGIRHRANLAEHELAARLLLSAMPARNCWSRTSDWPVIPTAACQRS